MAKKKFDVLVREVWVQVYEIEADSQEEAIQRTWKGEATLADGRIEYSHRMKPEEWTAEEQKAEKKNVLETFS